MKRSARSAMAAGVSMLAVSAAVIAPVHPNDAHAPDPTIRLTAAVEPLPPPWLTYQGKSSEMLLGPSVASVDLPNLLVEWLERIIVPPSAGAPFPEPEFPPVVGGNSIDSAIKNIYNAIEPWVEWGFDVAAYAVGWVPYVGWLAPQIEIFYNFGERIVRSITFNVADWLGGNISFGDGLGNVVVDTINSFIYLANDQLAFWLPPLPPIPPIGPLAAEDVDAELRLTSVFDESAEPAGTEEQGEEPTEKDFLGGGERLTQDGELTQEEGAGELDVDLSAGGEEQIEGTDAAEPTSSPGTVRAQGQIRHSLVAAPGGRSDGPSTPGSRIDRLTTKLTELAQSLSPKKPSSTDDGAGDQGAGDTTGTQ
ncbi:hypothetical protein [Mycolicibacterium gadium]|uniref:PE-PPE domain-containing protein n=1 Tax=Mycolicibacterium gadium TaxID=1794 RepID=A0ABT6GUU7_MYCGU|nr:hypothetical protein [Mycolicibacterium gadium]MDG5484874.1 hypothetical protein [Mycolicibacterium gadium]